MSMDEQIDIELNKPEKLRGQGLSGPIEHHVSIPEARKRMRVMEECVITNYSNIDITNLMEQKFGMTETQTRSLMFKCLNHLSQEGKERRPYFRDMARRRIHGYLRGAREDKKWGDIANLEKVLADIEGTKIEETNNLSPTEQRYSEALKRVLNEADPEEITAIIERERTISANGDVTERETCLVNRKSNSTV